MREAQNDEAANTGQHRYVPKPVVGEIQLNEAGERVLRIRHVAEPVVGDTQPSQLTEPSEASQGGQAVAVQDELSQISMFAQHAGVPKCVGPNVQGAQPSADKRPTQSGGTGQVEVE
eukprot:scaffold17682_cov113-Isochrysis_galbana.AAC.1